MVKLQKLCLARSNTNKIDNNINFYFIKIIIDKPNRIDVDNILIII